MGAWGTAIFSNDTSRDVQDEYKGALMEDLSDEEATQKVLDQWGEYLDDPDEGPDILLGLAATQWKLGRLEDWVKERALRLIDTGADVERWRSLDASEKDIAKRSEVLQKLKDQLLSPQPAKKKVRKDYFPPIYADLQVGDAISYRLDSGKYIIFRTVDIQTSHGVVYPSFELCDWVGDNIPAPETIMRLPYAVVKDPNSLGVCSIFSLHAFRKRDFPADRVQVVARGGYPHQEFKRQWYWGMIWLTLEEDIKERFGRAPDSLGKESKRRFWNLFRR